MGGVRECTGDVIQRFTGRTTKREQCGKTAPISITINYKQTENRDTDRDGREKEGW